MVGWQSLLVGPNPVGMHSLLTPGGLVSSWVSDVSIWMQTLFFIISCLMQCVLYGLLRDHKLVQRLHNDLTSLCLHDSNNNASV